MGIVLQCKLKSETVMLVGKQKHYSLIADIQTYIC